MPFAALTSLFGSSEYVAVIAVRPVLLPFASSVIADSCERDLADIYRDYEWLAERFAAGRSRKDPVLGGDHDAGYPRVVGDVVRGAVAAHDLDIVVVASDQAVFTEVQCLLAAVCGEVARPEHV